MVLFVFDIIRFIINRTNQLVVLNSIWVILGIVVVVGVVSLAQYHQDLNLGGANTVSAEPLSGDVAVSVLVPAWNESDFIGRMITSFEQISYPHRELVICAGGSDDTYQQAKAAADESPRIRVIKQSTNMNKQAALNACLKKAKGEIFYLIDGDCVLNESTWNTALRPIIEDGEKVVAGTSRPLPNQWGCPLPSYQYIKEEYDRARRPQYVRGLLGRNAVVQDRVMSDLGEFDESVQAGTDYNLAKRILNAGYDIRFVSNSQIESKYPSTVGEYFSQQSRWLRNVFFLGRKWDETEEVRATVVTCSLGIVMVTVPLIGTLWFPLIMGWLALTGYGLVTRLRWMVFFQRTHSASIPSGLLSASAVLMFVEFLVWAYAAIEMLIPSRRRKW